MTVVSSHPKDIFGEKGIKKGGKDWWRSSIRVTSGPPKLLEFVLNKSNTLLAQ